MSFHNYTKKVRILAITTTKREKYMILARVWIDQVGEQEESTRKVNYTQVSQKKWVFEKFTIK